MPNVRIQTSSPSVGVRSIGRNISVDNSIPVSGIKSSGPYNTYGVTYNEVTIAYDDSNTRYDGLTQTSVETGIMPNTGIRTPSINVSIT